MASPAVVISQITVQVLGAILAPYTLVVLPNSNGSLPPTFPLGDTSGEESQPRIQVPNVGEIPPAIPTPIAVLLEDSGSSSTADTAAALARVAGSLPRGRNQEQYAILVRQGGRGESLTKELKGQAKSLERFRGKIFVLTGDTVSQVHVTLSIKTVRLAYVNLIPWMTFRDGIYGGIDYEIWNVMAQKLNVSATFSEHKTYSSILKMAANGSADVAIGQSNVDVLSRYKIADVSPAIFERVLGLIEKKPGEVDSLYTVFSPFSLPVWLATIVSLMVVGLVFWLIEVRASSKPSVFHTAAIALIPLVAESLPLRWFNIRMKFQGYLLLLLWLPLSSFLSLFYESTLLANLVRVSYEEPIGTFERLLESDVPLYVVARSVIPLLLENHSRQVVRKVHQDNVLKFFAPAEMYSIYTTAIAEGKGVSVIGTIQMHRYGHILYMGKDFVSKSPTGYWFTKGYPLKPAFDQLCLELLAAGLPKRAYDKHTWAMERTSRDYERKKQKSSREVLGLRHTLPMFTIAGMFLAMSALAWAAEVGQGKSSKCCWFF